MKDIYELLNDVEIDLEEYNNAPLDASYKRKLKSMLRKRLQKNGQRWLGLVKAIAIACSITLIILFATYRISPVFATSIPLVGNIIKNITGYEYEEFDRYTSIINETKEKDNLKITLNEVMLDDNQLRLAFTIKTTDYMIKNLVSIMTPTVEINGEQFSQSGVSGIGEYEDEKTLIWITTFDVHDQKLPSQMKLDVYFENLVFEQDNAENIMLKGPWAFQLNLSKETIRTKTEDYHIGREISHNKTSMELQEMTITPLTTYVSFKFKGEAPLDLILRDDQGRELMIETSGYGDQGLLETIGHYMTGSMSFSAVPKDSKELKIIPYYKQPFEEKAPKTELIKYEGKLPLELKQNEKNKIIIYSLKRQNGKVYIDYKTEGQSCTLQKYLLFLHDKENTRLVRINNEGNDFKVNSSTEMHKAVFEDTQFEELYLGTDTMEDIDILEEEAFTVKLTKRK